MAFYRDLIGMGVVNAEDGIAFLAFGTYHHHVALNTWHSKGQGAPALETTGLYHFAIRYPARRDLAAALKRLQAAGVDIDSSSDCAGGADSIYLHDADQNGLELTWDRPRELRPNPRPEEDRPLDLLELLSELD